MFTLGKAGTLSAAKKKKFMKRAQGKIEYKQTILNFFYMIIQHMKPKGIPKILQGFYLDVTKILQGFKPWNSYDFL